MKGAGSPEPAQARRRPAIVAVDLGAESCRISLLRWRRRAVDSGGEAGEPETPVITMAHRFPNGPVTTAEGIRWDLQRICAGVDEGLRRCAAMAEEGIASIGVDGWAVDYVRLGEDGLACGDPFCYRDPRTIAAEREVHGKIPPQRLYSLTGAQILNFNTVYQLYADRLAGIPAQAPWVNLPEYILYRLGGRRVAELTNATHSGLVSVAERIWCAEVFDRAGLDPGAAPELVPPGTDIGPLRGPLAALPALQGARLIAPACHDTASAIAGIPRPDTAWAYISSGTWSLVGTLLEEPCVTEEAYAKNFTNLGAAAGRTCFHRNVNGLWLLRQSMETWAGRGRQWSIGELIERAAEIPPPDRVFDVNEPELSLPGDMPARINLQRKRQGLPPLEESPENAPAFASLIFHSLAVRYAEVLRDIQSATGKPLEEVYVVGGGGRNWLLTGLARNAAARDVHPGATESSTIGNLAVQLSVLEGPPGGGSPESGQVSRWASRLSAGAEWNEGLTD